MKRKEGLPIVVFNGDTEMSEVLDIISEDFEGDIVIKGNLMDSYVQEGYKLNLKAGIFVTRDIEVDSIKSAETLFSGGDIFLGDDFYVKDLICGGQLNSNDDSTITVFGDMSASSIDDAKSIEVLGSLICDGSITCVNEIFVNETFSIKGEINGSEKIFVKHFYK